MLASLRIDNAPSPDAALQPRLEASAVKDASTSLAILHPMPVLPSRSSRRRSHPDDTLKQIEYLCVEKPKYQAKDAMYSVNTVYTIKMYYRDAPSPCPSHIPVHGRFGDTTKLPAKPSAVVHVSFENFMQLRYDAYEIAKSSHADGSSCGFCQRVMAMNASSKSMPRWTMMYFKTGKNVRRLLTSYLTEMLQLVQLYSAGGCSAQDRIPRLLQIFFAVLGA